MDIIAGLVITIFLFYLFFISKKINVHKKVSTALLSGFIVFVILTKKIPLAGQKIGIIIVSIILIYAVNLQIKKEEQNEPSPSENEKKELPE